MIFQAPLMLLLLALLPLVAKVLTRAHRLREEAAAKLRGDRPASAAWKRRRARQIGAFAALVLALARPGWNPHPGPPSLHGRDLVIALDISRSMLAADVFPTRLEAAKIALHEALPYLQGQRVGLILFAGAARVRVPLTRDHDFVRYMLDRSSPSDADVGSTSLQSAIEKAIDVVLKESDKGQQDLIIFTDGEDHISDSDKMAAALQECGARVLIIGLGDPVAGARVPGVGGTNTWMQYKEADVISRLDEETLIRLSSESPNVVYHAARTRPFDLVTLYRQALANTELIQSAESGDLIYTEGYPFFIALALLLMFCPIPKGLLPLFVALLVAGCAPKAGSPKAEYAESMMLGTTLWSEAQNPVEADPRIGLPMLLDARAAFLRAALLIPADEAAAQQIAGVTAQIRAVEEALRKQEEEEADLQQRLEEAIERLQALTRREGVIAKSGQQLLKKRPPATNDEKTAAAAPALREQSDIRTGTGEVLEVVREVQGIIRKAMSAAFGETDAPPTTEYDGAIECLDTARGAQQTVMNTLAPEGLNWPHASSSMLTANRQMQEALRLLSNQGQNQDGDQDADSEFSDDMDWEFEEDMEWSESDAQSALSMPMSSQDFKTALENRTLPTPNYTAEEILMQEAANQEKRAQQKASRSGSKVEKNW